MRKIFVPEMLNTIILDNLYELRMDEAKASGSTRRTSRGRRSLRLLRKPNVPNIFLSLARFDIQGIERDTKKVNRVFEDMFDSTIEERKKMMVEAKGKGGENNNYSGNEMKMRKDYFLQFLLELHENEDTSKTSLSSAELKATITLYILCP
ncbi:Cytochrome P [Trema orientale]|uniref:Cytochrome P n=1 Tax=Trema orientale TaxID=63057 RepID=A0A2P5F571_TREOI|nr:Cytochrome P [Trema orientale]